MIGKCRDPFSIGKFNFTTRLQLMRWIMSKDKAGWTSWEKREMKQKKGASSFSTYKTASVPTTVMIMLFAFRFFSFNCSTVSHLLCEPPVFKDKNHENLSPSKYIKMKYILFMRLPTLLL